MVHMTSDVKGLRKSGDKHLPTSLQQAVVVKLSIALQALAWFLGPASSSRRTAWRNLRARRVPHSGPSAILHWSPAVYCHRWAQ